MDNIICLCGRGTKESLNKYLEEQATRDLQMKKYENQLRRENLELKLMDVYFEYNSFICELENTKGFHLPSLMEPILELSPAIKAINAGLK